MLTALPPTQNTIDIVAALNGTWHGSYALCRCPAHNDQTPSLSIRQGHKGILVHCFAGCQSENVLREIARIKPTIGAPRPSFKPPRNRENAARLWGEGLPLGGTIADRYRQSRHLLPNLGDVRYHPRCPYGRKPNTVFKPTLLVAVRNRSHLVAIQRISLTRDGLWHQGKMMLGTPGKGAWSPPFKGKTLALAESMEDAGAFARIHSVPCWSSLGAERMPLVRIPDSVEELIIAEDNNRAGRLAALAAIDAHALPGRVIRRAPPPRPWEDWSGYLDHLARTPAGPQGE